MPHQPRQLLPQGRIREAAGRPAKVLSRLTSGGDSLFVSVTSDGSVFLDKRGLQRGELAQAVQAEPARSGRTSFVRRGQRDGTAQLDVTFTLGHGRGAMRIIHGMTLLVGSGVLMACGTASTSTTTTYSTLSDACAADCARYGAPCNDPAYSDPVYQQANPGLTPVQICTKSCNGTSYQSVSASFDTLAACDSAYLALITCRARLVCGAKWGYACTELCAKEWDAVDQVCACNEPRCGTLVTDACTLKAGHCWPLCPTSSTCSYGVCSSTSACVPACTGSTTCVNGTCHDVCSDCLSSCHGLSGCCTGTGCICESACH